jgi:predicted nucleic acid-binding protein
MRTTFVDASFLFASLLTDDANHERAWAWERSLTGRMLTTEYVLIELADGLSAPTVRDLAVEAIGAVRSRPGIGVVVASTALMNEGLALYRQHRDKRWSLTDCISFVVMRREGIRDALTSDHDFEQAGFRALLRTDPP